MQRLLRTALLAVSGVSSVLLPSADQRTLGADGIEQPHFERDIVPILRVYCWSCHGGGGLAADLDLRSVPLMLRGGTSGAAIELGSAEKSLLFHKIRQGEMPPEKPLESNVTYSPLKLSGQHVALIRSWLDQGARADYVDRPLSEDESPEWSDADRRWWAFQRPVKPPVPDVADRHPARTPIDAFVLETLQDAGLSFSSDADATSLVRRIYLDLIGIPPSPDESQAFQQALLRDADLACAQLVDRLLASPHFGERWGRHWLDAAGYVDVVGTDNDAQTINLHEGAWRYRDYVVGSMNADKPFDQFLVEQLAGDELVDWRNADRLSARDRERLIATGFLRQAADSTNSPELNSADVRTRVLLDTVHVVSTNLLGMTVQCAQCHTHKFDPISHADYYRLAGIFNPSLNPQNWKYPEQRHLFDVSVVERQAIDQHNARLDKQIQESSERLAELLAPVREQLFATRLETVPESDRAAVRVALETAADQRSDAQRQLAEMFAGRLQVTDAEVEQALDRPTSRQASELRRQIDSLNASKRSYHKVLALWETGPSPTNYLFRRGDFQSPGPIVKPGILSILADPRVPVLVDQPDKAGVSSGRRLAFARWLTRAEHPLTARVFVNRIWQHYFGRGIVSTPDNFGQSGAAPSHPKLLDWLAVEFVESGWSIKHVHRLIVTSTVYRQSSSMDDGHAAATSASQAPPTSDPENRLLWRMPLRRLESEALRDSILAASGCLNRNLGGPPVPLNPQPDGSVGIAVEQLAAPGEQFRRGVYVTARRNYHLTELNLFDQPVVRHNCTRRESSAVVLQSLSMLNSKFIFEQSRYFAERVAQAAGSDQDERIDKAFWMAFGRPPSEREAELSRLFLSRQAARYGESLGDDDLPDLPAGEAALQNLCQMLLNTNEFLYIR